MNPEAIDQKARQAAETSARDPQLKEDTMRVIDGLVRTLGPGETQLFFRKYAEYLAELIKEKKL